MISRWSLVLAISLYASLVAAQEKVQTVCEILEHLDRFSGKLVSVRAKVLDLWLEAEDCKVDIRVEGVAFDNLIAVEWPDSEMVRLKQQPKVPFSHDDRSFRRLEAVLGSTDKRTHSVYADVEGLIVTRNPPLALVWKNLGGENIRIGFGHLGQAPAEIIVKLISAIEIVPRKETRQ